MPYNIRKQKCTQSDGDKGTYVLSYTTKKGKKVRNCHTSKKKAQGQIAAIEGPREGEVAEETMEGRILKISETRLRTIIRKTLLSEDIDIELVKGLMSHADPQELESAIGEFVGGEDRDPEETAEDLTSMLKDNPEAIEAALEDEESGIMDVFKSVASEDEDLMKSLKDKLSADADGGDTTSTTGTTTTESVLRLTRSQIRDIIREAISDEEDEEDEGSLDERDYGEVTVSTAAQSSDKGARQFYSDKGGTPAPKWKNPTV